MILYFLWIQRRHCVSCWRSLHECIRSSLKINKSKSKVIKCISGRRMNVAINGELLEEVECFEYLGSKMKKEVKSGINDIGKVLTNELHTAYQKI